ncbi:MAG: metallophosphoesterase [Clostridium sp.]|jgi:predicted MPP superfamily phosphohydrolase|nr:metallophosphoesterase [Clostridium sp.]
MKKLKRIKRVCFFVLIIFAVFIIVEILRSNFIITTKLYNISKENVPVLFNGYKIVLISDLHSKKFGYNNKELINIIDKQSPDIIVMSGDMISTKDKEWDVFLSLSKKLAEKYETYYVVGNHEQNLKNELLTEFIAKIKKAGIVVLDNEKTIIEKGNEKINLYGLWFNLRYYKDLTNEYQKDIHFGIESMEKILGTSNKEDFNILITHNPIYYETYSEWGSDLTLCGHMHGGMIRLPFIGGLFSPEKEMFPKYDSGVFYDNNSFLVVSRGLGNGNLGFRFLNCPEVTVITLNKK